MSSENKCTVCETPVHIGRARSDGWLCSECALELDRIKMQQEIEREESILMQMRARRAGGKVKGARK